MGVVKLSTAGILDYQKYSDFLAGNFPANIGDYDLLATTIVGGTAVNSVSFDVSTYASQYKHLQIRALIRSSWGDPADSTWIRFNTDVSSGNNYTLHYLQGNGTSVSSGSYPNASGPFLIDNTSAGATAAVFTPAVVDILDPFSSTKNTTMRALWWPGLTGGYSISLRSSVWLNTDAVNLIKLGSIQGTPNFVTGCRFSLYGLKG